MCCPEDIEYDRDSLPRDPAYEDLLSPWEGNEVGAVRNSNRLHYWPDVSYPVEVVSALKSTIQVLQDANPDGVIVVETGVALGYITRRLAPVMRPDRDLYWAYEAEGDVRMQLSIRDFWFENLMACIKEYPTPYHHELAAADVVIIDSENPWMQAEFYLWQAVRKEGSMCLIPSPGPDPAEVEFFEIRAFGDVQPLRDVWSAMVERTEVPV